MTKILLTSPELTILIISFLSTNLKIALKTLQIENFKKHLMIQKMLLATRQPKKLRNLLVRAKFETKTIPKEQKLVELFLCNNCVYHKAGYIIPCSSFSYNFYQWQNCYIDTHKIISLVTVKMLFVFWFVKLATIFILDKLKNSNKELQNINQM